MDSHNQLLSKKGSTVRIPINPTPMNRQLNAIIPASKRPDATTFSTMTIDPNRLSEKCIEDFQNIRKSELRTE